MSTVKRVEIKSHQHLKKMLQIYFADLEAASHAPDRHVAWCTSVGPCEILIAFGFSIFFPENHGAMLGAKKMAADLIPYAVGAGYSAETCSYMNCDIGSALTGRSPLSDAYDISGPPTPDLLVYNTNQCREVQDWFGWFSRKHNAPSFGIMPPRCLGTVTKDHVAFVKHELELLIERIEEQFKLKLDPDRLEEAVVLSSRASTLWHDVIDTAKNRPAAISFWDGLIQMSPVILMRGSQAAIDYYEMLLAEMRERVADGIGAVPGERWRLYWDGMPIWPRIRDLSEKFMELRTVVAASTYCNSWAFPTYENGDPLEWMARTSLEIFINRDEGYKEQFLAEMMNQFSIDGAIFHNARTCPNNTNSRFGMVERLRRALDLPVLVIDGDLSDARFFSTAQTMTNIEAFIEQLEERRR